MSKEISNFFLKFCILFLICHYVYSATDKQPDSKSTPADSLQKETNLSFRKSGRLSPQNAEIPVGDLSKLIQNQVSEIELSAESNRYIKKDDKKMAQDGSGERFENTDSVAEFRFFNLDSEWLETKNFVPFNRTESNTFTYIDYYGLHSGSRQSNSQEDAFARQLQDEFRFEFGDEMYAKAASTYKQLQDIDYYIQSSLSEALDSNPLLFRTKQYFLNLEQQLISLNLSSDNAQGYYKGLAEAARHDKGKSDVDDGSNEKLSVNSSLLSRESHEMKFIFILKYFSVINFLYLLAVVLIVTAIIRSFQSTLRKK